MNYLGHLLLTYPHRELTMGNLLGDIIRGNEAKTLSPELQMGFVRHHEIDKSTDQHRAIRELISLVRPVHGKYAPVVIDILLDHVLAKQWEQYFYLGYPDFTQWVYDLVNDYIPEIPFMHRARLQSMADHRWIDHYDEEEKLYQVLLRMDRRASFPSQFVLGVDDVKTHWEVFKENFDVFYREMMMNDNANVP